MLGHLVLWKCAFHAGTKADLAIGDSAVELASFERRLGRDLPFAPAFAPKPVGAGRTGYAASLSQIQRVAVG